MTWKSVVLLPNNILLLEVVEEWPKNSASTHSCWRVIKDWQFLHKITKQISVVYFEIYNKICCPKWFRLLQNVTGNFSSDTKSFFPLTHVSYILKTKFYFLHKKSLLKFEGLGPIANSSADAKTTVKFMGAKSVQLYDLQ